MKKILSLVLAAVMVLGMGVTGFAAYVAGETFSASASNAVTDVAVGGTLTATVNLADLVPGNSATLINDTIGSFATQRNLWTLAIAAGASASAGLTAPVLGDASWTVTGTTATVTLRVPDRATVGDWFNATYTLTAAASGVNYTYDLAGVKTNGTAGATALTFNFYGDVGSGSTNPDAPKISTPSIANNATGVSTTVGSLRFTFDQVITTNGTVTVLDADGNAVVLGTPTWNAAGTIVTYTMPTLAQSTKYTVTVAGFASANGTMATATYAFTTSGTNRDNTILTTSVKVSDFRSDYSLAYGYDGDNIWRIGRNYSYEIGTVHPADKVKLKIWLTSDMFLFNGSTVNYDDGSVARYYLGSQVIKTSRISARTQIAQGSKAINSTEIKYDSGRAYVEVKFNEEFVNTDSLDLDFTVYLLIDGKRKDNDGEGLTFRGKYENYIILVYSKDDYVDTSLGEVAEAVDFVSDIEVDLGNGVSIFTKFFKGKKYYGTATRDADEAAEVVFARYPDVDNVVILKTVGLNSTGDVVKLSTDYSDYYVYDKDLNYLGQSNAKLKFSSRYYLANRALDVEDEYEGTDEPESYDPPADTGGDNGISNANANPGTGC